MKIKDSTWPKISIKDLNYLEGRRSLFLRATQDVLAHVYKKNFKENEKVLEIGAGTGFMKKNWPKEYKGTWIQLEPQYAFIKDAAKRTKNETFVHANVYDIPFENESFDVVCGFCSYDVFMDLDRAVDETYRVLKKGGLFFHLLDAFPCRPPVEDDFKKMKLPYKIMGYFPEYDYKETPSISFIPEDNLQIFNRLTKKANKIEKLELWKRFSKEIGLHDYFEHKLAQSLLKNFHNEVRCNKLIGSFKGEMTEQQRKEIEKTHANAFCNDAGHFSQLKDNYKGEMLKKLDQEAYEKMSQLEISVIRYVKTRK